MSNLPALVFDSENNSQLFTAVDDVGREYWFTVHRTNTDNGAYYWLANRYGVPISPASKKLAIIRVIVETRLARGCEQTDETRDEYNQRTNYGAY
jgi:hypothetical protein